MTGPSEASSSPRQAVDAQTLNPTQPTVRTKAIAKRMLGRRPDAGAFRQVRPPDTWCVDPGDPTDDDTTLSSRPAAVKRSVMSPGYLSHGGASDARCGNYGTT